MAVNQKVKETFDKAKAEKKILGNVIDCPICFGNGNLQDAKTLKLRPCAGCRGSGKIRNIKFKHPQA